MIRPYQSSDRKTLLKIFGLNTPKYFDPKEANDFEEYLDENGKTYLTVEIDNEIIGGVGYQFTNNNSIGRITWIFFHPDKMRSGLGSEAVTHCLNLFRANPSVKKSIVTTSQLAYKFFEKFGYEVNYVEKNYWGEGLDLYKMEMNIQ